MENIGPILLELSKLESEGGGKEEVPKVLDDYLLTVAKTGGTLVPWAKLKSLFRLKLELVIKEFLDSSPVESVPKMPNVEPFRFEEMKQRIMEQLDSYTGIPFTMQRLCELITEPRRHYKRIDKFMRGLEKIMLVVTTIEPEPEPGEMNNSFLIDNPSIDSQESSSSNSISSKMDLGEGSSRHRRAEAREEEEEEVLESPAKRMRLDAEEEEAGPCDSADAATPHQRTDAAESSVGNECGAATPDTGVADTGTADAGAADTLTADIGAADTCIVDVSAAASVAESSAGEGHTASADSTPAQATNSEAGADEDSMEIDAECSSSQAKIKCSSPGSEVTTAATESSSSLDEESSVDSNIPEDVSELKEEGAESKEAAVERSAEEEEVGDGLTSGSAMDVECGNEEGISTSVGSISSTLPQPAVEMESNSEAEAREGEEKEGEQVEEGEPVKEGEQHEEEEEGGNVESSSGEAAIPREKSEEAGGIADSSADKPAGVLNSSEDAQQADSDSPADQTPDQPGPGNSAAVLPDQSV